MRVDMAYNEYSKNRTTRYLKNKQKSLTVRYKKDHFDERIKPAIERSGMPLATFVKTAVDEKIKRDGLDQKE